MSKLTKKGDAHILRVYAVVLVPDGRETPDELDPREITLSYAPDEAKALDPFSKAAKAEAFKRAEILERREFNVPAQRQFFAGEITLLREKLIPAKA